MRLRPLALAAALSASLLVPCASGTAAASTPPAPAGERMLITPGEVPTALPAGQSGIRPLSPDQQAELAAAQGAGGAIMGHTQTSPGGLTPQAAPTNTWQAPGVQGVDVSNWQGDVDWAKVSSMGAMFAYAKATEGLTYKSPNWSQQYNGAAGKGLIRGSYHFALPPISSGADQARYFVANGGGWSGDGKTLPPLLDIEFNKYEPRLGNMCYDMTPAQLSAWIGDFVRTMDQLIGRHPAIYTNKYWWDTCVQSSSFGAYPLHIARYAQTTPQVPAGWQRHTIWQYSNSGPFVGDSNAFNGTYPQLVEWARNESSIGPNGPASTRVPQNFGVNSTLTSPNGKFKLVMQPDGNLVTCDVLDRPTWASDTSIPGLRLAAQPDGNLVMYDPAGRSRWFTNTSGPSRSIVLQDDGNLVVRDGSGRALWDAFRFTKSGTYRVETTVTGLGSGQTSRSLGRGHLLAMQPDGNLVLYAGNRAAWSSGTFNLPGARFVVQPDGNAVVYHGNRAVWSSGSFGNPGASLVVQTDGNLVLYKGSRVLWHSGTGR